MNDNLLLKAYKAMDHGQSCAFATIVESTGQGSPRKTGSKMLVLGDGTISGSIGGGWSEKSAKEECLKSIKEGKPYLINYKFHGEESKSLCGGEIKIFIEPFAGIKHFILCGGGHIGLSLSMIVKMLNFRLTVLDVRDEFANKLRFPHADKIIVGNPSESLKKMKISLNDYVMIVTHSHEYDFECLRQVAQSEAAYIGVISSKSKKHKIITDLKSRGASKKEIDRISMPSGLDIGAQTPEEIAVSISAELVLLNNKQHLNSAKFKKK